MRIPIVVESDIGHDVGRFFADAQNDRWPFGSAQGAGASKLRERAGQNGPISGSFGLTKKLHVKTLLFQKLIFRAIL